MLYLDISAVKSFEVFTAAGVGKVEYGDKLDVFQVRDREVYVKGSLGEGWLPIESLKITKNRINILQVTELNLKLIIRSEKDEKTVKLVYTGANQATVNISLPVSSPVKIGISCHNDLIGNIQIDPKKILQQAGNSEYVKHEVGVYTSHYLINYLTVEVQIASNLESRDGVYRKRSYLGNRSNISEKFTFSCKATVTINGFCIIGQLYLTSYYFFISSDTLVNESLAKVWVQSIKSVKFTPKILQIITKDLRFIEILSDEIKVLSDTLNSLLSSIIPLAVEYCLTINKDLNDSSLPIYPMFSEFQRLKNDSFRLSYINIDYKICDTYPCLLFFPAHISDGMLKKVSDFRSKNRLPAVTWFKSNAALYRSSQPKLGLGKRSQDDEYFFSLAKIKYVIDARPGMNAKANRLKGKGYEREADYGIKLKFMGIQNIHHVSRSFDALVALGKKKEDFWLTLSESKWMSHIILILEAAICCSNHLIIEKASILVHCSDGWDRTSQICTLCQLLIDPHYRTLQGFQQLINKDWLAFGHKFFDRTYGSEFSPIFILFLDCVHQILEQFPEEFEFTQEFLIDLADSSIQGIYPEFLVNCEKDRNDLLLRTSSLISFIKPEWRNLDFSQGFHLILPVSTLAYRLNVWRFFTRYS